MAESDNDKPGSDAPAPPESHRAGARRRREERGERSSVSADDIARALQTLAARNPDALRGLVAQLQLGATATATATSHKLGPVLERVPVENIDDLVASLETAIEAIEEGAITRRGVPPEVMSELLGEIGSIVPELPAVMQANSQFRGKSMEHSIRMAHGWLTHRHGPDATSGREVRR